MSVSIDPDKLYLPGEVARIFRVTGKTVTRWCKDGLFVDPTTGQDIIIYTPGGHARIPGRAILNIIAGIPSL
jgi:hypothetical protein